jgi:hypothetical protein
MGAPRKKAKCAAGQWTIQIDLDLTSKKSIQIMRLAAGPGKSPDSSGGPCEWVYFICNKPPFASVRAYTNTLLKLQISLVFK